MYCSLCSWYLIGTSLDFVVVYRGHCNFVERRENHTVWFSLHQILLKLLFFICVSFCLHPHVFPPCTLYPSLRTCSHLACCVYFIFLLACTSLMLTCPIHTFLLHYSVVLCVLVILYHHLSLMVTKPLFALMFVFVLLACA